jgi:hypothetical protein
MTKHEWRERDEEGELVYFRAIHHAGRWQFYSTKKSDPEWNPHDVLPLPAMEALREVLWNKHQRRRLPLKQMEQIDAMLEQMREEAKAAEGEPDVRE